MPDTPDKRPEQQDLINVVTESWDIQMTGSIVLFSNFALQWTPKKWDEVTVESLSFLEIIWPLPALIVFGTGSKYSGTYIRLLACSIARYSLTIH